MGLVRQLDIKEYWNTDPATATPLFPNVSLRDRFLSLMTFLNLNDHSQYVPRGQMAMTLSSNRVLCITRFFKGRVCDVSLNFAKNMSLNTI